MFCRYCGKEIAKDASFCSNCGKAVNEVAKEPEINVQDTYKEYDEGSSVGWGFLGYFVPVVGLILFLEWKDTKPKSAKAAGIGALISTIGGAVLVILYFVLIFALGMSGAWLPVASVVNWF